MSGFHVHLASSATAGLDLLAGPVMDCIVFDYDMPEIDDFEFLETIRAPRPDLPFILYIGKSSEEFETEAIPADLMDYLHKSSGTSLCALRANRISIVCVNDTSHKSAKRKPMRSSNNSLRIQ